MGVRVERRPVLHMEDVNTRKDVNVGDDLTVVDDLTVGGDTNTPTTPPPLVVAPEAGVAVAAAPGGVQTIRLTLTDVEVAIDGTDDFGSALLATLPDTNLRLLGVNAALSLVKDGVVVAAANDLAVALGTAAASNTTLDGAMADLLASQALTDDADTVPLAAVAGDGGLLDPESEVHLNVSADDVTGSGTVTASGTIDLFVIDLGAA